MATNTHAQHLDPQQAPSLSRHAAGRLAARHIGFSEVCEALANPTRCDRDAGGFTIFGSGLAVVLDVTQTVIITVYRAEPVRWRGPNEGVSGYRRNPYRQRARSSRRRT